MKENELKKFIYSKYRGFELRIPITDDIKMATLVIDKSENSTVADFPYASYKRVAGFIYDEHMVKMFLYELVGVHRDGMMDVICDDS